MMKILFYLIVMFCLILFPDETAQSAWNALSIWGKSVVPSLFPYMLFCRMLCASIAGSGSLPIPLAGFLGMLGGSPSGAMLAAGYSQSSSARKLYTLIALTGTISPMFILGTLRGWTNDPALCRSLLISHWAGAVLAAIFVYTLHPDRSSSRHTAAPLAAMTQNPISQSIDAILQVGGCIIGYSVLASIIGRLPSLIEHFHPVMHAVLEISGGTHAICQSTLSLGMKRILLSAALGFSGFSILSQNHTMLKSVGISMRQLLLFALLRALCSAICMLTLQILGVI